MSNKTADKDNIYVAIYEVVRAIPAGRVSSYGAIAASLGVKSGARLVGYAMNNCHHAQPPVPAHRVVNRVGLLTGKHHFNPPELMAELLQREGVGVKNDQVQDFATKFWYPAVELLT
jgi:methylated-DNA-protein-cysteine methyltransferase-like protein